MNKHYAREGATELIRALCRLVDSGVSMSRDQLHNLCEQERFIDYLLIHHKSTLQLDYLDKNSIICKPDVLEFFNNALSRHANVVVMEEFGLKNNALLLGVNLCLCILQELEDAT